MAKLSDLTLDELYDRPKRTPKVLQLIREKEDFSKVNTRYCENACKLCSKKYGSVSLLNTKVDVLILQNHHNVEGTKYQPDEALEAIHQGIFHSLAKTYLKGFTYRILNLVKCKPAGEDVRKGNGPTYSKQQSCSPYLLQEIVNADPKVLLITTTEVCKALDLKGVSASSDRGSLQTVTIQGKEYPAVVTIHAKQTQYIRQNARGKYWGPDYLDWLRFDFTKARSLASGEYTVQSLAERVAYVKANQIRICRSIEDVKKEVEFLMNLPPEKVISFDIETNSLDPYSEGAKILCYQFGYRDSATGLAMSVVITLWHRDNTWYDPNEAWTEVVKVLHSDRKKVAHNGKFDVEFTLVTTGVRVKNFWVDTMLLLHWINSGIKGSYGLKQAVHDILPHSGLGGYEDALPKLTGIKKDDDEEELEEGEDEGSGDSEDVSGEESSD